MRRTAEFLAALALLAALSVGSTAAVDRLALPIPGPILGLLVYTLLLSLGFLRGSIAAARWLSGLLGAMIVPALVSVVTFAAVLGSGGWRLAVALIAGVAVTGLVTAVTFRLAGGTA